MRVRASSRSSQHVADRHGVPMPSACSSNTARVQRLSDFPQRSGSSALNIADDRQHVGRVPVSAFPDGPLSRLPGLRELRSAQLHAARLSSGETSLGPVADHVPLMLGHRCDDVDGQPVGLRHVAADEIHLSLH
jgi:hypothetical protein